jgi:hypothetical protein
VRNSLGRHNTGSMRPAQTSRSKMSSMHPCTWFGTVSACSPLSSECRGPFRTYQRVASAPQQEMKRLLENCSLLFRSSRLRQGGHAGALEALAVPIRAVAQTVSDPVHREAYDDPFEPSYFTSGVPFLDVPRVRTYHNRVRPSSFHNRDRFQDTAHPQTCYSVLTGVKPAVPATL